MDGTASLLHKAAQVLQVFQPYKVTTCYHNNYHLSHVITTLLPSVWSKSQTNFTEPAEPPVSKTDLMFEKGQFVRAPSFCWQPGWCTKVLRATPQPGDPESQGCGGDPDRLELARQMGLVSRPRGVDQEWNRTKSFFSTVDISTICWPADGDRFRWKMFVPSWEWRLELACGRISTTRMGRNPSPGVKHRWSHGGADGFGVDKRCKKITHRGISGYEHRCRSCTFQVLSVNCHTDSGGVFFVVAPFFLDFFFSTFWMAETQRQKGKKRLVQVGAFCWSLVSKMWAATAIGWPGRRHRPSCAGFSTCVPIGVWTSFRIVWNDPLWTSPFPR